MMAKHTPVHKTRPVKPTKIKGKKSKGKKK